MNTLSLFLDLGEEVELTANDNIECIKVVDESDVSDSKLILDAYPDIKDKLSFTEKGVELFAKITKDINSKNLKDAKEAEEVFSTKTPYITYGLIVINILFQQI